jgi:2-oxoglutarate ferredoxin oxidoreductase subunit delta
MKAEIRIIRDRCKGCAFCIEFCPQKVLVVSEEYNAKGYHPPKVANPEACMDCDMCETICPEFAIFTVRLDSGAEASKASRAPKGKEPECE